MKNSAFSRACAVGGGLVLFSGLAVAAGWPNGRGPAYNGVSAETGEVTG